jgi:hypothetical protein
VSTRSYAVGLPVVITVHDDGTVEYDVDTTEAGSAIWEDGADYEGNGEEAMSNDQEAIEADHDRRRDLLATLSRIAGRE